MIMDDDHPQESPPDHGGAALTVEAAVDTAAERARDAVEATATLAHDGADAAQGAATETARAFEDARDRLKSVGGTVGPANAMIEHFKAGTDALSAKLGSNYSLASQGMADFNAKAIEAWRTNAEASIAHWQNLAGVKSFSEMIALNAAHARRQIETMTTQTRDLAALAGQIARDIGQQTAPAKPADPPVRDA